MNVIIDHDQVARFADFLPTLGSIHPFDFCGHAGLLFPHKNAPGALEAFFFNAAHQFGFWHLRDRRYDRPMIAPAGGVDRKGSDFLFFCTQRALGEDAGFFDPVRLATRTEADWNRVFRDDHGNNPLPMWPEHLQILRQYPAWFLDHSTSPQQIVAEANAKEKPLAALLDALKQIPGYREDVLQKKAMLLAVILENRPEHFLRVTDPESAVPIIDYHLQRSALRTGLVKLANPELRVRNEERREVTSGEEALIRQATYEAIRELVARSGLSVAAVDYFFFTNRTRCPEMTDPMCSQCPVETICNRQTRMFQPVFRTTAY